MFNVNQLIPCCGSNRCVNALKGTITYCPANPGSRGAMARKTTGLSPCLSITKSSIVPNQAGDKQRHDTEKLLVDHKIVDRAQQLLVGAEDIHADKASPMDESGVGVLRDRCRTGGGGAKDRRDTPQPDIRIPPEWPTR